MPGPAARRRFRPLTTGSLAVTAMLAACICATGAAAQAARRTMPRCLLRLNAATRTGKPTSAAIRCTSGLCRRAPRHEGARYGCGRRLQHGDVARAVAPGGRLRSKSPRSLERPKARFEARLKTPRERTSWPGPPLRRSGAGGCARLRPHHVSLLLSRHHLHERRSRRDESQVYAVLKPGGVLVIADHSARPGDGTRSARPSIASRRARCVAKSKPPGFKLVAEGDFWRHPEDTRDFPTSRRPGRSTNSCSNSRSRCKRHAAVFRSSEPSVSPKLPIPSLIRGHIPIANFGRGMLAFTPSQAITDSVRDSAS